MFANIYNSKRVLITGYNGFKGSWLTLWLQKLGAEICGIGLPMPYSPDHYSLLSLSCKSNSLDINKLNELQYAFSDFKPEIVFHLAAQPLVRLSYQEPIQTFSTNIIGTANILECIRQTPSVKAAVIVSSDKCYENREQIWSYREIDSLGGFDPYSASKACTEIIAASYRNSFFPVNEFKNTHSTLIASARAGNVIGGGDWAKDRLIPDIVTACSRNQSTLIRNPHSIRPWQHVLEPLSGYLLLGQYLLSGKKEFAQAWNFGPDEGNSLTVAQIASIAQSLWNKINIKVNYTTEGPHEASILRLDCSKAHQLLNWHSIWNTQQAIERTILWYKDYYDNNTIDTVNDLSAYIQAAISTHAPWSK